MYDVVMKIRSDITILIVEETEQVKGEKNCVLYEVYVYEFL